MKTKDEHTVIITKQIEELRKRIKNEDVIIYLIDELALQTHFKERYEQLLNNL